MKPPILLRIYLNDKLEGVRQFESKQVVIGREAEVSLDLKDPSVSHLHAVIEERDSGYYILDLGSQAGTSLNGQKILDERLETGDEIRIGPYKLQFFIGVPKPAAPPSPKPTVAPISSVPPVAAVNAPSSSQQPPVPQVIPTEAPTVVHQPVLKTETVEIQTPPPVPEAPAVIPTPEPTRTSVAPVNAAPEAPQIPVYPASDLQLQKNKKGHKKHKTYAPNSPFTDARDIIRPSKGTTVEVLVTWKERVIAARNFKEAGEVTIGSDPTSDLIVPLFPGGAKYPVLKIQGIATVRMTQDMQGEVIRDGSSTPLQDLIRQNKLRPSSNLLELDLPQGEMVRMIFQGGLLCVFVRYVPDTPKPVVAPLLDLSASEVTGVILAFVVSSIFGLYMMIYAPAELEDEAKIEEPLRKAVIVFTPPPQKKKIVEVTEEKPKEQPPQKKVVAVQEKVKQTTKPSETAAGKPGKSAEAAPKPPSKEKPKLTSIKQGGSIKTAPQEGSSAKSEKQDPTKLGLMSVFGSKGTQTKLSQTFNGQGGLAGLANEATGNAGSAEDRAGDTMGSKFKDTGPGGKGTSSVGIAGVGTQGKGTGTYGLGTGGIGNKGSVDIDVGGQEAEFSGTIDREAIRRIIQANKNSIRSCYERSLQRKPDLYGKLILEWDIGERGRVERTSVKSNTLGDDQVASCIMARIRELKFPEPPADQIGRVTFPFVFSSQ